MCGKFNDLLAEDCENLNLFSVLPSNYVLLLLTL